MKKILCIGEALIDMICTDKGSTLADGEHFLKRPGGAPTNVAAAIAALGGQVELLARVGDDPFGQQLIRVMKDFGVGTGSMIVDDKVFTTFAFVSLLKDGERDFVFNRGADRELSERDIEGVDLKNVGIIHFGSATAFLSGPLQDAYVGLLRKARQYKVVVSFDPNYRHLLFAGTTKRFIDQSWSFMEVCDFFKVSEEEAMLLTGASRLDDALDELKERTSAVFALTMGKDGTMLRCGDTIEMISSIPVIPVDTTGAGDAFVGAILYQLCAGKEGDGEFLPGGGKKADVQQWRRLVANANKAGARTCEFMGAMEAFKQLSNGIFD